MMEKLSPREDEICRLLVQGMSNKEIARHLSLSPRTIEEHRAKIFRKHGVRGAIQLVIKILTSSSVVAVAIVVMTMCAMAGNLPNHKLTPGVARNDLTTEQICHTKWGKDHRHVTAAMKQQVFENYGLSGNHDSSCKSKRHFEIDHLISRELGGDDDVDNLWPQCYSGTWNAVMKDRLENRLHKLVCDGTITLKEAQTAILNNWISAYHKYVKGD